MNFLDWLCLVNGLILSYGIVRNVYLYIKEKREENEKRK